MTRPLRGKAGAWRTARTAAGRPAVRSPSNGGAALIERLFVPLGYAITATQVAGDRDPWPYWDLTLSGTLPLRTCSAHLYVLIPVLDDDQALLGRRRRGREAARRGEGWLAQHPERTSSPAAI